MKKIFLLVVLLFIITTSWSQRSQIIAYVDMEYILENVPEYLQAQNTLNSKVAKWRKKLDKESRYIEVLKSDLANEKAILTKDLIEEKEGEITLKQEELRRLESLYFGSNGDMFLVRKQLVKPIQDQVYNAVQSIAKRKKYDFVFEKSTDLVMLYSNKKYDISDLVLSTIDRTRLSEQKKEQIKNKRQQTNSPVRELSKNQKEASAKKTSDKEAQLDEVKNKKIEAITKKVAQKAAQRKINDEKRKARLQQREEKRKLLREQQEAAKKKKENQKKAKQKEDN